MIRTARRWAISSRVSGIRLLSAGGMGRSAAVMVRKAWASITRVVQRAQEVYWRNWCSSSPVSPGPGEGEWERATKFRPVRLWTETRTHAYDGESDQIAPLPSFVCTPQQIAAALGVDPEEENFDPDVSALLLDFAADYCDADSEDEEAETGSIAYLAGLMLGVDMGACPHPSAVADLKSGGKTSPLVSMGHRVIKGGRQMAADIFTRMDTPGAHA